MVSAAHCECRDLRPLLLSSENKEYVPIYRCVVITKYDNITELMTFRQKQHETTNAFVNRARHKGSLCDFGEPELVERIIELIIASTPHELPQKHLLDQDKGYTSTSLVGAMINDLTLRRRQKPLSNASR